MLKIQKLVPAAILSITGLYTGGVLALPAGLSVELSSVKSESVVYTNTRSSDASNTSSDRVVSSTAQTLTNQYQLNSLTKGNTSGWVYGSSNAAGNAVNFNTSSKVTQQFTITNNSSSDLQLGFNFLINSGALNISSASSDVAITSYFNSYISINNQANNPQWQSFANLVKDGSNFLFEQGGEDLGAYTGGSNIYAWDAKNIDLSLGTIASGETFILNYHTQTTIDYSCFAGTSCLGQSASATFGRLDNLMSTNSNFGFSAAVIPEATAPVSVSEPSSIALFGLGLTGLVLVRRKKALS